MIYTICGSKKRGLDLMQTAEITIGSERYIVEVAGNFISRMRGLAWRDHIDCDGMLFTFPFRRRWSVWMLGMNFPLDLVWLDGGRVVDVERGVASPRTWRDAIHLHRPSVPANGILEIVPGGTRDDLKKAVAQIHFVIANPFRGEAIPS